MRLAWAGWQLCMPDAFRPLRLEGTGRTGRVLISDGRDVLLQIKWRRVGRRFRPEKWLKRRVRKLLGRRAETEPLEAEGFEYSAWIPEAPARKGRHRGLWYGYSPDDRLLIEAVVNRSVTRATWRTITRRVLPSLKSARRGDRQCWAVFGSAFELPAEYELANRNLHLGDIALEFLARRGRRICVRQIYPSELALKRQSLKRWLKAWPFKRFRRVRIDRPRQNVRIDDAEGRAMDGLLSRGRRVLRRPFAWLRPHRLLRMGAIDETADRLKLCEVESRRGDDETLAREILQAMAPSTLQSERT